MCTPAAKSESSSSCSGKCGPNCPGALARAAAAAKAASASEGAVTGGGGPEGEASRAPSAGESKESGDSEGEPAPSSVPRAGRREVPTLDAVTTFGSNGSRVVLYPAHVPGPFYWARSLVGAFLIILYLALPWIQVGGAPAIFLNVAERRFHLFGLTFLTQDLWLGFFVISGLGFALFTVTAILGRVWCGWACPLTVFLDLIRKVERWIEGDSLTRKRLDHQAWSFWMGLRRALKHLAIGGLAALVAHGFLAYFVSIPSLFQMMKEAPSQHAGAFLLVAGVTGILWFCFGWFREQFCIVLCPYGRLQSVLTDEHSMVVGYDAARGEPRGKPSSGAVVGDCVDCLKCVEVCPTGIDIRQGLQLECIGCAACVDACDTVMAKMRRPRGLIRYDSLAGLKGAPKRFWRPRLALYGVLLVAGLTAGGFAVATVRSAVVSLTRIPGAPYFVTEDVLRNQFLLRVLNKHRDANRFSIALEGGEDSGVVLQGDSQEEVPGWGEGQMVIVLTAPVKNWRRGSALSLVVRDAAGRVVARKPLTLMGPDFGAQSAGRTMDLRREGGAS